MFSKFDWRPLLVVPATIGTLATVVFAFSANADAAAQFFGAFLAAGVAAGAVIATTNMQAAANRKAVLEERLEAQKIASVELYIWMATLASTFSFVGTVLESWAKDGHRISAQNFRSNVSADIRNQLRTRIAVAATLPTAICRKVLLALHSADSALDTCGFISFLDNNTIIPPSALESRAAIARFYGQLIEHRRALLGIHLQQIGVLDGGDSSDDEALKRGEPVLKSTT